MHQAKAYFEVQLGSISGKTDWIALGSNMFWIPFDSFPKRTFLIKVLVFEIGSWSLFLIMNKDLMSSASNPGTLLNETLSGLFVIASSQFEGLYLSLIDVLKLSPESKQISVCDFSLDISLRV